MDGFKVIRLKEETIKRFKLFSKRISKTYSGTLELMIDFFEWHNYSPGQRFAKDLSAGQELNRKRIEAVIAIIKSIEKAQNIPLVNIETMLKSLFEEEVKKNKPKRITAKSEEPKKLKEENKTTQVSQIEYERSKQNLKEVRDRLQYVLNKIELVSNRFGKDFLKVEITREELARFKRTLKNE